MRADGLELSELHVILFLLAAFLAWGMGIGPCSLHVVIAEVDIVVGSCRRP